MKVVYDYQIFHSQAYGGISRYFHELITRAVASRNLEVALYLGLNINQYGLEKLRFQCSDFFGKQRRDIPKSYHFFSLLNQIGFSNFVKRSNPNCYHATYYSGLQKNFRGLKVLTVYDMIHEIFPQYFSTQDRTAQKKHKAVQIADQILAISESTKRDLIEKLGIPPAKITVTYLANSLHVPPRENSGISSPFLLYVGGRGAYKNFDRILSVYQASEWIKKELKLVCFGGGAATPVEREKIRSLGLSENITFLSGPDDLLASLYSKASAFVFPSLYEGFGLPPLEAMYYGCPVIASPTSSIPEVIGPAGLYADPNQTDEWIHQIQKIVHDSGIRESIIQKGFHREKEFSWDRCFTETEKIYLS